MTTLLRSARAELNQTQVLLDRNRLQAKNCLEIAQADVQAQEVAIAKSATSANNHQSLLSQLEADVVAQNVRLKRLKPLAE